MTATSVPWVSRSAIRSAAASDQAAFKEKHLFFYAGGLEANQNAGGSQLMILKELYKYQLAWLQRTPCMCLGGKRLLMCNVNNAYKKFSKRTSGCLHSIIWGSCELARCTDGFWFQEEHSQGLYCLTGGAPDTGTTVKMAAMTVQVKLNLVSPVYPCVIPLSILSLQLNHIV